LYNFEVAFTFFQSSHIALELFVVDVDWVHRKVSHIRLLRRLFRDVARNLDVDQVLDQIQLFFDFFVRVD